MIGNIIRGYHRHCEETFQHTIDRQIVSFGPAKRRRTFAVIIESDQSSGIIVDPYI